ncbi:hypothetical protein [Nocardioides flavescens]|uniref:Uncharacterized protein n=1 Tax=Nocardioides flavescens TaxID=2691959 RepID=A0A6L7EWH4_9ACTN|nr:hypothetical protein [Nocardioides flavescens]MXG89748.1 hypothetical protein [Nocardioides flavescens]
MDDLDLATRLDRSIGSAPHGGAPLPTLIAEGRRVVRRRRLRAAALSLAAVVALGGSATAFVDRSAPTPAPTGRPDERSLELRPPANDMPLTYTPAGDLRLDPAYEVVMRVDNPYFLPSPDRSVALVVQNQDGERFWGAAFWYAPQEGRNEGHPLSGSSFGPAAAEGETFQTYVDQSLPVGTTTSPARTRLVRFEGDGFTPLLGVTVLEGRSDVDLGTRFATGEDDVAAAEVRSPGGDVYYVLGRQGPVLEPWVYVVTKAEGGADLDAFLDYARDRWGGDRAE